MSIKNSQIRLYLDVSLSKGQAQLFNKDQTHYLHKVMRLKIGDTLNVFNGREGAWKVKITEANKKRTRITRSQTEIISDNTNFSYKIR